MRIRIISIILLSFFLSQDLISQAQKIVPENLNPSDLFGFNLASSGNELLVSCSACDDFSENGGQAYLFTLNNSVWEETGKIVPESNVNENFTSWLAMSNDHIVLASHGDDNLATDSGAIEIYRKEAGEWVREIRFNSPDGVAQNFFGWQLSISNDIIAVGSPFNVGDNGVTSGKVILYENLPNAGWTQTTSLHPSDGATDDYFGSSVFIKDNLLVVGARRNDEFNFDGGAIYVFEKINDEWVENKLVISDVGSEALLGYRVHTDGNKVILSGYGENNLTGSVYIFSKDANDEWIEEEKILANDSAEGDWFGSAINISGDKAYVGARNHDEKGAIYQFEFDGTNWIRNLKLFAPDGMADDRFGSSLLLTESNHLIVGAFGSNEFSGAIYAFDLGLINRVDELIQNQLSVYPNPAIHEINIELKDQKKINSIKIRNLMGQTIASYQSGMTSINIFDLVAGEYILEITDQHDNILHSKFIKL